MDAAQSDAPVSKFIEAAIRWGKACDACDSDSANAEFDRMTSLFLEIETASDGPRTLLITLSHEDPYVQLMGASLLLKHFPDKAEPILEQLARTQRFPVVADAKITLAEWRAGRLRFPPY